MSSQEEMRLVAQVVNKFSQPIIDLQRALKTTGDVGKAVHTEGQKYAKAHRDSFEALRKSARETSDHFKNVFNPVMTGLGISAIGTGAAIAGMVKGIKDLGEFGREMSFLSKETGLSTNQLNTWVEAGARAGLAFGQVTGELKAANEVITQFRKQRGPLMDFFPANMGDPIIAKLHADMLAAKDQAEEVELVYEALGKLPDATKILLEEATHLELHRISPEMRKKADEQTYKFSDADKAALEAQQKAFDDTRAAYKKFRTELSLNLSPAFKAQAIEWRLLMQGEFKQVWRHLAADASVLGDELKDIFGSVGQSLGDGLKASMKDELAELNAWWEGHGDKAKPNPNPKILGPGDPGYAEAPTAEKMAYHGKVTAEHLSNIRGSASDIRGMPGSQTPGAEIRQEAIINRATMRGTMEGSRQGFLAAFHELDDKKKRGGIQNASYETGEGGGIGSGLGGGSRGGRGGPPGGEAPALTPEAKRAAAIHAGQRAIIEGHVKEAAAAHKASVEAAGASGDFFNSIIKAEGTGKKGDPYNEVLGYGKYGRPPKPLTDMSLGEVYKWGQEVLRPNSGMNSSAAGAFQIVGKTMKEYMGKAGLGSDDKFSPENQRKLALQIMKGQGSNAWEGFKSHPRERRLAEEAFRSGQTSTAQGGEETKPGEGVTKHGAHGPYVDYHPEMKPYEPTGGWPNEQHKTMERTASVLDRMRAAHGTHGYPAPTGKHLVPVDIPPSWVPKRTGGGPADAGKPYLVGEKGPELFVPAKAGHISPNDDNKPFDNEEFKKFIEENSKKRAVEMADKTASARMDILRGHIPNFHPFLGESVRIYMSGIDAYKRKLKAQLKKQLFERQGEANTGATLSEYGFKNDFGKIPDRGLTPQHDIGKHHRGEQDPAWAPLNRHHAEHGRDPDMNYWWNLGRNRQHMQRADLLGNARKAGLLEQPAHKVTGEASMRIDLRGFPKGTKTQTAMSGMFSKIRVARGRAMPLANQDG